MRMKAVLSLLIVLVLTAGCGYKMALPGKKAAFTLYPSSIQNGSDEVVSDHVFVNEIKSYLVSINALENKETAEFVGSFTISEVKSSAAIMLTSGQTATVDLTLVLDVEVKDKKGKNLYKKDITATSNYSISSSNPTSMKNRDNAIREAVRTAMETFRYGFENR